MENLSCRSRHPHRRLLRSDARGDSYMIEVMLLLFGENVQLEERINSEIHVDETPIVTIHIGSWVTKQFVSGCVGMSAGLELA